MATLTKITPCLWFDTQGEEAATFYTSIFDNSRIVHVSHYTAAGPRPVAQGKFGVSWQIVPLAMNDIMRDPDTGKAERAMKAVLGMGKIDLAEVQRAVAAG